MRVLAFSDFAWPEGSGGVERTLAEIYPRLVRRGHTQVQIIALAGANLPRQEDQDGVLVRRARRVPLERLTGAQVSASLDAWPVARRAVREFRPDLVHVHSLYFHTSLVGAGLARAYRLPLLVTMHLGAVDALPQPYRAASTLYERTAGRLLLANARRIICVSNNVREHALSLGAGPEKSVVVPNGVDCLRYAPGAGSRSTTPTLLCVGRLIFNKGQHILLEAVAALRRAGIALRVLFAGDGPMEQRLRRQAAELGLDDATVIFLGRRDDVGELLSQADLFVRPSLSEGMSLAVLEAMAAGLPVVVTDVSGNRELTRSGHDGVIVPPGSAQQLAAALRRLVGDAAYRKELGARGRQRALQYDWSAVARQTEEEMIRACA